MHGQEPPTPLTISNRNGTREITFSAEVIENVRYIYTRMGNKDRIPVCLSIVSALRGEGVTTIAQALAATLAHDLKARVCLVDLNWWWPSRSPLIDGENPGLAGVFTGEVHLVDVLIRTGSRNLYMIPAGSMPREDRAVAARTRHLKEMLGELSQQFEYMILDVPAILSTNDAVPLASLGSACCLVISQGVTSTEDVRLALDEISHLKVLGVVLNRTKLHIPKPLLRLLPSR
jgi:Mrp family chromosome partitioning ATPase